MKVDFADGDRPGDDVVVRAVRDEMDSWKPRRGPDWDALIQRAHRLPSPPLVMALSGIALAAILIAAVVAMTTFDVGPLAGPVPANLGR